MGKVSLGHNVWVGNRCTISKGAVIPDYGIIASNSLVSRCLTNKNGGGIWAGMPVSLKQEGFYRILDEDFQYKMFIRFSESQDIKIDKELSENELRHLLHM